MLWEHALLLVQHVSVQWEHAFVFQQHADHFSHHSRKSIKLRLPMETVFTRPSLTQTASTLGVMPTKAQNLCRSIKGIRARPGLAATLMFCSLSFCMSFSLVVIHRHQPIYAPNLLKARTNRPLKMKKFRAITNATETCNKKNEKHHNTIVAFLQLPKPCQN